MQEKSLGDLKDIPKLKVQQVFHNRKKRWERYVHIGEEFHEGDRSD